ncbi:TetR/AcrR family transcriptional regulator [Rhodococcus jostii]|uniref:TetR/AcrR family transcriptional regulator n=1 Tax=Rhodococcus jostii TaxID=132919 RepID=A0ABU4CTL6_RHOJO|nr:TetR/AcrR family transcriptional regulator [Rhodococcus jostii]MDV6286925.1 TetR/AcrR family transcriptional regulator [Rhodococcus jostii]RYE40301.1 MAG: TetR/AcrR family transcriptional regulator [Hyphomicrobiales bacterium]
MPRSNPRDGAATRRALIDAATKLFASEGVEKVSIRAINAEAGLGAASAHYHFGSKDAILDAVLIDAGADVLAHIHALTTAMVDSGATPNAKQIVNLLAIPYRKYLGEDPDKGVRWLTICGQLSLANDPRLFPVEDDTAKLLRKLLERAYPHADDNSLELNWSLTVNTLIVMAARWSDASGAQSRALSDEKFDVLVDFVAGGLETLMSDGKA